MKALLRFLLIGLAGGHLIAAEIVERTVTADESVTLSAVGGSAVLAIRLDTTPDGAPHVRILQNDDFVAWSAPLERGVNAAWQTTLDARAAHRLLIAQSLAVAFVNESGDDTTVVSIPRSRFADQLAAAEVAVDDTAPFFDAPDRPAAVKMPDPFAADRTEIMNFAADVRAWDAKLTAYGHQHDAAESRAHSLWLDLHTAGQIPWSQATIDRQEKAFKQLGHEQSRIVADRAAMRQRARDLVAIWRRNHPDNGGEINLTFLDIG